jgi:PIN domain nuclease of toxin-antitoxin system
VGPALNVLLDTSTLLWLTREPERVSSTARAVLDERDNVLWISAASAWEIATKHRLGRLLQAAPLVDDWEGQLARFQFRHLDITNRHALRAGSYEVEHGDPFDRMIAAQAELEEMTLVARDRAFDLFPVTRLW